MYIQTFMEPPASQEAELQVPIGELGGDNSGKVNEGKAKKRVKRIELGVLKASEVGRKWLGGHLRGGSPAGKVSPCGGARGIFYPVIL